MINLGPIQPNSDIISSSIVVKSLLMTSLFLFTGCLNDSSTVKRELAFRLSEGKAEHIFEKIHTIQTTTFLTPEGSRTKKTNRRIGYFYESDKEIKINFLSSNDDIIFLPFGKGDLWIGIKQKTESELTYIPFIDPEKIFVFSLAKGIIFVIESSKCFYIKKTNQIFYKAKATDNTMILTTSTKGTPQTTKATDSESKSFASALENNIDFEKAIYEDSITTLGMKEPYRYTYSEIRKTKVLNNKYYSVDSYRGPGLKEGFVATRAATNQKCVITLEEGTNLTYQTEIIGNKLLYYDGKYENGIFTTELKVRELDLCRNK